MRRFKVDNKLILFGLAITFGSITLLSSIYAIAQREIKQAEEKERMIQSILATVDEYDEMVVESHNVIDDAIDTRSIRMVDSNNTDRRSIMMQVDPNFVYMENLKLPYELQEYTWEISEEYNIRYTLLLALMYRESGFNVNAVNHNTDGTTDSGLMQLNDTTRPFLQKHNITDYMNPYQNILGGAILLRHHLDNNNQNEQCALMAYQYGQTGAQSLFKRNVWTSNAINKLYRIENAIISNT